MGFVLSFCSYFFVGLLPYPITALPVLKFLQAFKVHEFFGMSFKICTKLTTNKAVTRQSNKLTKKYERNDKTTPVSLTLLEREERGEKI